MVYMHVKNNNRTIVWSGDLNVCIFKQMTLASDPQAEFFSFRFLNLLVLKVPLTQKLFYQQSKSYCPTNKKKSKKLIQQLFWLFYYYYYFFIIIIIIVIIIIIFELPKIPKLASFKFTTEKQGEWGGLAHDIIPEIIHIIQRESSHTAAQERTTELSSEDVLLLL